MGCFPSTEASESSFDLANVPLLEGSPGLRDENETLPKYDDARFDSGLETLLLRLEHGQNLGTRIFRSDTTSKFESCRLKIIGLLNAATMEMGRLTKEQKYHDVEKVVKAVMRFKNALGDEFFEAARINAFGREITELGDLVLTGGQYFKPVMIQEDDDNTVKLYFFIISDAETTEILYRYYLEHTSFLDEYFALGLVTRDGHTQVEIYGSSCPLYWKVRKDVLSHMKSKLPRLKVEDRTTTY